MDELAAVGKALRDYIDAIPSEVQFTCAMPGVDREWVDSVLDGPRKQYTVELIKVEHTYARITVLASSKVRAKYIAEEKILNGEIIFDSSNAIENDVKVVRVIENKDSSTNLLHKPPISTNLEQEQVLSIIESGKGYQLNTFHDFVKIRKLLKTNFSTADNTSVNQLLLDYKARLYQFRHLPKTCQLAIIHYMSVDGAAWAVADKWPDWKWGEGKPCPTSQRQLRDEAIADCEKFLPKFVEHYGQEVFGFVNIPTEKLVTSIQNNVDYCPKADKQHLENREVWEYDSPTWPVILSSFSSDETLQDGWHRFYRYRQLGFESIDCVFYV